MASTDLQRKSRSDAPSRPTCVCGESFRNAQGLGNHRRFCFVAQAEATGGRRAASKAKRELQAAKAMATESIKPAKAMRTMRLGEDTWSALAEGAQWLELSGRTELLELLVRETLPAYLAAHTTVG